MSRRNRDTTPDGRPTPKTWKKLAADPRVEITTTRDGRPAWRFTEEAIRDAVQNGQGPR